MIAKQKDLLILVFLFLLAFIIRLLLISKGPFHMDTLDLAINAKKSLDNLNIHYMHGAGYPLTIITGSVFIFLMRLVGIYDPVLSVNFMSVVFGSLSIVIFYLFSKKIIDTPGALIATLIFLFLPLNISLSTFGMTHPLSIFLNLLGLYFLFLYFDKYGFKNLILSSFFLGLAVTARLMDCLIIIAVIFLYLIQSFKNSKLSKNQIIFGLIIFFIPYTLVILALYLPMFINIGFSQFRDLTHVYYFYHSLTKLLRVSEWLVEIFSLEFLIVLIAGIGYFFIEKNRIIFNFLIIWFLSLFLYYGSFSTVDHRYLLFSIVPLLIMQGYFISRLYTIRYLGIIFTFFIFILIAKNFLDFYPILRFRHNHNLQKDFGEFIKRNTEPDSYIIAIDEGPFIEYYAERKILYRAVGVNKDDFDYFFKKVDTILEKNMPIYIINSIFYSYDPKKYFIKVLSDNYVLKYIGSHLYENWNRTCISRDLFIQKLHKIEKG